MFEVATVAAVALMQGMLSREQSDIRARFEASEPGARARRNRLILQIVGGSISAIGGTAVLFGWLMFDWPARQISAFGGAVIILATGLAILGTVIYRSAFMAFSPQAALDIERQRKEEQAKLEKETTLPALLQYNRDQMYSYHQIATTQARAAGRNSQAAMAIGFLALVAGSAVAIASGNVATKLIIGGLAALGGVFSGYIARTFLMAHAQAVSQLYRYWEQPLTASYVLAAERVTATLDNDQAKERQLAKIIDQLLAIAMEREILPDEPQNGSRLTRSGSKRPRTDAGRTQDRPAVAALKPVDEDARRDS